MWRRLFVMRSCAQCWSLSCCCTFIFWSARRFAGAVPSACVTLLVLLGPLNSYTVYLMPEATYFFAFWVLSWVALGTSVHTSLFRWASLGAILGLMALVKPHALFLTPALMAFAMYMHLRLRRLDLLKTLGALVCLCTFAIAVKLVVGYLIVGKQGLTLFGSFYSGMARNSVPGLDHYLSVARYSGSSLAMHVSAIALALGVPLAGTIAFASHGLFALEQRTPARSLAVYCMLVLGSMVLLSAFFTGSLASANPAEIVRLHQRYYDFALPLLMLVAAAMATPGDMSVSVAWRILGAGVVAAFLAAIFMHRFNGLRLGVLDGPWFAGLVTNRRLMRVCSFAMFVCVVAWSAWPRQAAKVFLWVVLPLSCLVGGCMVNQLLAKEHQQTVYEKAGKFARIYLDPVDLSSLVVVCSDPAEGYRVMFNVDAADASFQVSPVDKPYDWTTLPAGKRWILSLGSRPIPDDAPVKIVMPGFVLARAPDR